MPVQPNTKAVPIKEAMQIDPSVASSVRRLQSGELSLESPCGEELEAWTEEDKQTFTRMMQREIGSLYKKNT